ncbi:hypothetical protein N665_1370s0002 [Sinapis alba]|nr:hypothetical protein N665_1370s0002 [Sinapis alba]
MKAIPSTYHQCIKFPTKEGTVFTLKGNQRLARSMSISDLKSQQVTFLVEPDKKPSPQKEDTVQVGIDPDHPERTVGIGSELSDDLTTEMITFLRANKSTFAWTTANMPGIDPAVTSHRLNVDPTYKPIKQKRRKLSPERPKAVNDEVDRLLGVGSIAEVKYPDWLANPVVVKKKNGKWRVCIDFTDLNKACPKDSFPLPHIGQMVESTAGNELLSFMDAFSGYSQIMMHPDDREKTSFITDRSTYCYRVMPFGHKNARATYQRLVNKMFADKLGVTTEVYIDEMLVKSLVAKDHVRHLSECFDTLNKYGMKLNPAKCTFGVTSGEFLGYIVTKRGIEANPKQISAVLDLPDPKTLREIQRLTGRVAALNRFISRSTDKCLPFYELLRGNKKFLWDEVCEQAFSALKQYFTTPPVLTKPDAGDTLYLYIAVSSSAVSSVLIKEDRGEQHPIFYTSKHLTDAETRYPTLEKMALAVVTSARKLQPYFQSHSIVVLTDLPLRTTLQNANQSGRLSKWAIELSEYDISYKSRPAIKAQVLADFIVEISPDQAADLDIHLVTNQFRGDYEAKNERLDAYLGVVRKLTSEFDHFELVKVPRKYNCFADALAALGSNQRDQAKRTIPIHTVENPSISLPIDKDVHAISSTITEIVESTTQDNDWRTPFLDYLDKGILPEDKWESRRLKAKSSNYVSIDGKLHRWTANKVLLTCVEKEEAELVMIEIHEGEGGNHSGGRALALKLKTQGNYCPTMVADCEEYASHCEKSQRHAPNIHSPTELLKTSVSPYPFMRWAMDIVGPLPSSKQRRFLLVLTDYFTKWVEAKAYVQITENEVQSFVWNFSTPRYPQGNGQAEATNKTIIDGIKKRLDLKKGHWTDELDGVLWSHQTTPRSATAKTPFSLAYGVEAMAPAEVNVTSLKRLKMPQNEILNHEMMINALDQLEERRDQALLRIQNYQHLAESYYNKKVRSRPLQLGDLVRRKVFENTKEWRAGKLGANWEGPYKIIRMVKPGVYRLETSSGEQIPRSWDSINLKRYLGA